MVEGRRLGVERQQDGQVEVVLPLGQRLDAQAGAVEEREWHGAGSIGLDESLPL